MSHNAGQDYSMQSASIISNQKLVMGQAPPPHPQHGSGQLPLFDTSLTDM